MNEVKRLGDERPQALTMGERSRRHLDAFLSCTVVPCSPVHKLRGLTFVLNYIWTLVCEEWWDLHIERSFPWTGIPDLSLPWKKRTEENTEAWRDSDDEAFDSYIEYPEERQACAGCPVATLSKGVNFPPPTVVPPNTFANQNGSHLYVNMLPFVAWDLESIPECCRGYRPMLERCLKLCSVHRMDNDARAYLTIDERSTVDGFSQRRPGLHVESPGVLPVLTVGVSSEDAPYKIALPGGRYVPAAEHYWGMGRMLRQERVMGGVFMASNIGGTTAVWNCHINNAGGGIVGPHGDIEHLRPLLGPCARTLEAGELVWMTDRTPHESLPVPATAVGTRRQYFRLVVGTVSAWFADHSTPNPVGCQPHSSTRIVRGDKFQLYASVKYRFNGHCGSATQLAAAREFRALQTLICRYGLGHLAKRFHEYGIVSLSRLCELHRQQVEKGLTEYDLWDREYSASGDLVLFDDEGYGHYEYKQMRKLLKAARALLGLPKLEVSSTSTP